MENRTEVIGYPVSNTAVQKPSPVIGLEAVDQLVLTAILLFSVGLSLNGTFVEKGDTTPQESLSKHDEDQQSERTSQSSASSRHSTSSSGEKNVSTFQMISMMVQTIIPTFVNTISLFSLSGEVYKNDTSVMFFLVGLFLSIVLLAASGIYSVFCKAKIYTISSFLKQRYNNRTVSYMVAASAVARHVIGGALNVYVAGIAVSSAAGISSLAIMLGITVTSSIGVTVGGIQSENSYRIGSLWLGILGLMSFITLCMATSDIGGVGALITKANIGGKLKWPSGNLSPWEKHSYWSLLFLGIFMGFQMFLLARTALRHAVNLRPTQFYIGLLGTSFLVSAWALVACWSGICSAITFAELIVQNSTVMNKLPKAEGSLMVLVALKLQHIRGFRGFFVASLLAASISGLTRRFNQLISVIWEVTQGRCTKSLNKEEDTSSLCSMLRKADPNDFPEEFQKEISWHFSQKRNSISFMFKTATGFSAGAVCIAVLSVFHKCNLGGWELWQGTLGVICGSVVGAIILGIYFPCFPHMSVVLGLIAGWCVPCYLVIANLSHDFSVSTSRTELMTLSNYGGLKQQSDNISLFKENFNSSSNFTEVVYNEDFFKQESEWILIGRKYVEIKKIRELITLPPSYLGREKRVRYTSYCYYGLVGMVICVITAFIFTALTNNCRQKEFSPDLMHPIVHRFLLNPSNRLAPPTKAKTNNNKKVFFSNVQEKAGF